MEFEKEVSYLEVENFFLKKIIKDTLKRNVELNEELSCRTIKFENAFAKLEKQSLKFEIQWQRKIEEKNTTSFPTKNI